MGNSLDGCCMSQMDERQPSEHTATLLASNPNVISRLDRLEILRKMSTDPYSRAESADYEESEDNSIPLGATNGYNMPRTVVHGNNVDAGQYPTQNHHSESVPPDSAQLLHTLGNPEHPMSSPIRCDLAVPRPILQNRRHSLRR